MRVRVYVLILVFPSSSDLRFLSQSSVDLIVHDIAIFIQSMHFKNIRRHGPFEPQYAHTLPRYY